MFTIDPFGRVSPDQRELSRRAADRYAQLQAIRAAKPHPKRPAPPLGRLRSTFALVLPR